MAKDRIPIDWLNISLGLLLIGLLSFWIFYQGHWVTEPFVCIAAVLAITFLVWAIWGSLRSFELDEQGIHIFHCGRYRGTLRWEQIQQIGILRRERQSPRGTSQLYLVVIPKGVEPFAPDVESGAGYLQRNSRHILAEHIKYAPIFKKYYGLLDFDVRNYNKR